MKSVVESSAWSLLGAASLSKALINSIMVSTFDINIVTENQSWLEFLFHFRTEVFCKWGGNVA